MTRVQTETESYVLCKTGGGRVMTLEYRLSETTLPVFELSEQTPKKASFRPWNKAIPNAKKKVGLPAVDTFRVFALSECFLTFCRQ
jgi:hypothetical protein